MLTLMLEWLIAQQFVLSIALLIFIMIERFCLRALSPSFAYKLTVLIPLAILFANLPETIKPLQNSTIGYYLVKPSSELSQVFSLTWFGLYFTIASLLLVISIVAHYRFVSRLRLFPIEATKHNTLIGISAYDAPQNIYTSAVIGTPMVIGIFKSKLVLPQAYESQFDAMSLTLILEHESIHIQRKDNLLNGLFLLSAMLVWFNPLVWLGYASFRRLQELSCDQDVLSNKPIEQHILYSKALLNCATNGSPTLMAYSHYGDKTMILQRLTHIRHNGKSSTLAKTGLLLVAGIMLSSIAIAKAPDKRAVEHQSSKQQGVSPVWRVDPVYPTDAAAKGVTGSVVLKYDINADGTISNISIVEANPKWVFETSAKESLSQWRYAPSDNGYKDILVQLDFALDSPSTAD